MCAAPAPRYPRRAQPQRRRPALPICRPAQPHPPPSGDLRSPTLRRPALTGTPLSSASRSPTRTRLSLAAVVEALCQPASPLAVVAVIRHAQHLAHRRGASFSSGAAHLRGPDSSAAIVASSRHAPVLGSTAACAPALPPSSAGVAPLHGLGSPATYAAHAL
ncbi:hypothetical protein BS78_04G124200 [Paspalum vaginatum]|nr:hypothetical protein BS78_04G124200 [Paspalum vaginatum]